MDRPQLKVVDSKSEHYAIRLYNYNVWFGDNHVLNNINLAIKNNATTCLIGPSGSGKSTLLRSINRINDVDNKVMLKGEILYNNKSILDKQTDLVELRTKIGMVFQKPCVFPMSIKDNVLFGIKHHKNIDAVESAELVEKYLKQVSLWDEVKHRLNDQANSLSIGQQQRLCIARTLAVEPQVLLMDEPTSSLDPVSTKAIEDLVIELSNKYTILFVTHNINQAKRIANQIVFISNGVIVEQGDVKAFFEAPKLEQTISYINS